LLLSLETGELAAIEPNAVALKAAPKLEIGRQSGIFAGQQARRASRTIKRFLVIDGLGLAQQLIIGAFQSAHFISLDRKQLPFIAPDTAAFGALIEDDQLARIRMGRNLLHIKIALRATNHYALSATLNA
jgi:hypothetical protein